MVRVEVHKMAYAVPVTVLGHDNQGRTLVRCPSRGCGETATVLDDGCVSCPVGEAEDSFLAEEGARLIAQWSVDQQWQAIKEGQPCSLR
jgi:hypothetical protein